MAERLDYGSTVKSERSGVAQVGTIRPRGSDEQDLVQIEVSSGPIRNFLDLQPFAYVGTLTTLEVMP